mgnify:CR=1 FL=1
MSELSPLSIAFLAFPNVTRLDLTGPAQVLSRLGNTTRNLVWKDTEPVPTDAGFPLLPTATFDEIDQVDMAFDLEPTATHVKTKMQVRRVREGALVLDGVKMTLNAVSIDGVTMAPSDYQFSDEGLTHTDVPDRLTLETDVTIYPSSNTELSCLYISVGRISLHCESTGFRRISYWPDRPDVMISFQVPI